MDQLVEGTRRSIAAVFVLTALLPGPFQLAGEPRQQLAGEGGEAASAAQPADFFERLVAAGHERTRRQVRYDGAYRRIPYPMGDVPDGIGVCTDLVIRSYRAVGLDLQELVHEDMRRHFSSYPPIWGLSRPDPNIDHRRVPNLRRFFERRGASLPISARGEDYRPGDLVTWTLPSGRPHIGLVSEVRQEGTGRRKILHNIGSGPELEDMLFRFPITGHYRFSG